jgi:hypothetical protein
MPPLTFGRSRLCWTGDLVAEEPRRARAGVGDQGFLPRQLQLEVIAQECREAGLDLLSLGLRPGEPEEVIVGLCRLRDYAEREVNLLVRVPVPAAGAA